jgi:hypothetical protein
MSRAYLVVDEDALDVELDGAGGLVEHGAGQLVGQDGRHVQQRLELHLEGTEAREEGGEESREV